MNSIERSYCYSSDVPFETAKADILQFALDLLCQLGTILCQLGSCMLRKVGIQQENFYATLIEGVESDAPEWHDCSDYDSEDFD